MNLVISFKVSTGGNGT